MYNIKLNVYELALIKKTLLFYMAHLKQEMKPCNHPAILKAMQEDFNNVKNVVKQLQF